MKSVVHITSRKHPGLPIKIDAADAVAVTNHRWTIVSKPRSLTHYAVAQIGGKQVYLHRFLLRPPRGVHVNHKNGDGLDCRRANMELCTQAENNRHAWTVPGRFAGSRFDPARPRVNRVKRKLADGTYRTHLYDRVTGKKFGVE